MLGVALAAGLAGGLAGGLVATTVGGDGNGDEGRGGAATSATAAPDVQARIRAAVDRVLPNVVMVIADVPDRAGAPDADTQNFGSGVLVSQAGHVVTNYHVIEGATSISVLLSSGEERPARLVSDDSPFTDLAVLSIAPQGLRSIPIGNSSSLKAGDVVLAITGGGGFGQGNVVMQGVVSATGRAWPRNGVVLEDLIQTDAALNAGDSGGALVNLDGEFVGLLTTVVREGPSGQVQGVGFAQSADVVRPIVADIIRGGKHPRARLGIERPGRGHIEITPELATERRLPVQEGVLVIDVPANSAAARAGVQPGDIILGTNGVRISFDDPFVNLLKRLPRGVRAELHVLRGGRQFVVPVTPEE